MEKVIFAAKSADFGLKAVRQHNKSVEVKKLGYRGQVVRIVTGIRILHVNILFSSSMNKSGIPLTKPTMSVRRR